MPVPPQVGDTVWFVRNDDRCVSPAVVINTAATTRPDVLAAQQPAGPDGAVAALDGTIVNAAGQPIRPPTDRWHADLLVHGLVRDYRAYNIPPADTPTPGCWSPRPSRQLSASPDPAPSGT